MTKDEYKGAVKDARNQLKQAFREYRKNIKKAKLIRRQSLIKVELENMGIVTKQIPVIVEDSKPQRVKVRVEPSNKRAWADNLKQPKGATS